MFIDHDKMANSLGAWIQYRGQRTSTHPVGTMNFNIEGNVFHYHLLGRF
jgi:hypothetical protein